MRAQRRTSATYTVLVRIGVTFLVVGVLLLMFAFFNNLQVLALSGLGLTFWGALFLSITPFRYVESSLLESTAIPTYGNIDRALGDSNSTNKAYYLPRYTKDVYLPDYLKGLKDTIAFIPTQETAEMPAIDEIAKGKFKTDRPSGLLIMPPGLGLLSKLETKTRIDFTKTGLEELIDALPQLILDNLSIAKEIEMSQQEDLIRLTIKDSYYQQLYSRENNLRSIGFLGCPIASAVACALAKASGRPIAIQKIQISLEDSTTSVFYSIIQG
jgi:hypothetical protein